MIEVSVMDQWVKTDMGHVQQTSDDNDDDDDNDNDDDDNDAKKKQDVNNRMAFKESMQEGMKDESDGNTEGRRESGRLIKLPTCPICKTKIRKNLRYGKYIYIFVVRHGSLVLVN